MPLDVRRKVLLECGHKCSIPQCPVKHGLEIHHINGNRADNREENLLVLCTKHHRMVRARGSRLDREKCEQLKRMIAQLSIPPVADKHALRETWRKLRTGRSKKKREVFEFLAENLLASVPGFIVAEKRDNRLTDEALVLIRNEAADGVLNKLGEYIAVECKARKGKPVRDTEVAAFLGEMALNRCATGFLFSLSGFTPDAVAVAGTTTGRDFLIVPVAPPDVTRMIEAENRAESVKQAVKRSCRAR